VKSDVLARRAAELAADELAQEIVILDLRGLSDVVDFFVIVSGMSEHHLVAVSNGISQGLKDEGTAPYHREGEPGSHWILLDYVDVVVHILLPMTRQFYALEELWGDAPMEEIASGRTAPEGYDSPDDEADDGEH
jgi:ribosome-associated protein